jgi:hypothetical protein
VDVHNRTLDGRGTHHRRHAGQLAQRHAVIVDHHLAELLHVGIGGALNGQASPGHLGRARRHCHDQPVLGRPGRHHGHRLAKIDSEAGRTRE